MQIPTSWMDSKNLKIAGSQADLLAMLFIYELQPQIHLKQTYVQKSSNQICWRDSSPGHFINLNTTDCTSASHMFWFVTAQKINSVCISDAWLKCFVNEVKCLILSCSNMFKIRIILSFWLNLFILLTFFL